MDDQTTARFIEVVHSNDCLWSVTSKAYKSKLLREDLWKSIGLDFNMTGEEAYGHFRRLREKYRREKEKEQSNSGAAARRSSKWIFLKNLEFLDEAYKRRKASNSQAWGNSTANEEDFELRSDSQSPQLDPLRHYSPRLKLPRFVSPQQTTTSRSLSRSRSKTPEALNSIVDALNSNTAKMLSALKADSPIEGVLTFVRDTYNNLENAKAKEFERKIMELSMEYRYGK